MFATPVFDTYWRFACARQDVFMRRVAGQAPPWTEDTIISAHRFTNAYRASDRVSQYLIRHVQYEGDQAPEELFYRTVLFKFFNKIETWESLCAAVGVPTWKAGKGTDIAHLALALDDIRKHGEAAYSAAYIMPNPPFSATSKSTNHLLLLEHMMNDKAPRRVADARSLESVYRLMRSYPSLGDFLAFQFAIDLNYSTLASFSEMDFVVAGPGAKNGIQKCFSGVGGLSEADVIRAVCDMQETECERLGLKFQTLWGRRLQLIDCQNLFCETDKYARVAHPEFAGDSGRTKIKQRFTAAPRPVPQWYPPKWNISIPETRQT